jgi:hypothetical protein
VPASNTAVGHIILENKARPRRPAPVFGARQVASRRKDHSQVRGERACRAAEQKHRDVVRRTVNCVAGQGAFGQKHLDALKRIPDVKRCR